MANSKRKLESVSGTEHARMNDHILFFRVGDDDEEKYDRGFSSIPLEVELRDFENVRRPEANGRQSSALSWRLLENPQTHASTCGACLTRA